MPGLSLGPGLGLSARPVAAAAASEKFPDPTLAHVTDSTNGWSFSNGFPTFGPKSGTGPGIQASTTLDDDNVQLVGADDAALAAAVTNGHTYTVAITFANVSVSKNVIVQIGAGGVSVNFAAANGVVTHNVTAGNPSGGSAWYMSNDSGTTGAVYDITHISVT